MDLNNRFVGIEDLDDYLNRRDSELAVILITLKWAQETLDEEIKVQCPKNSHHWMPKASLSKHLETCSYVEEGYLKEDIDKQPPDSKFFYQKASSVVPVTIDRETQSRILREKGLLNFQPWYIRAPDLPKTVDRWCVQFSPEQRLAIYDYIVKQSKGAKQPAIVTLEDLKIDFEKRNDQDGKPKTPLEILAEQRDYKRRRQSYRAKNVHITKKSYTEVMKEVIENQISYLAETRKQETTEVIDQEKPGPSSYNYEQPGPSTYSYEQPGPSTHNYREQGPPVLDCEVYPGVEIPVDFSRHKKSHRKESDVDRSRSPSPKKHKYKRKHSRSRSRSHHRHKKSHKHKKSKD